MITINGKKYRNRTVRDVLTSARTLIKDVGWTQRQYASRAIGGQFTGFCALGAINVMQPPTAPNRTKALKHLVACTGLSNDPFQPKLPGAVIATWNDHDGRTRAQVLALFTRAIRRCA